MLTTDMSQDNTIQIYNELVFPILVKRNELLISTSSNTLLVPDSTPTAGPMEAKTAKDWEPAKWFEQIPVKTIPSTPMQSVEKTKQNPLNDLMLELDYANPKLPYIRELKNRLNTLAEAVTEEYPDQEPISRQSVLDFINLLKSSPSLDFPDIFLTWTGNIQAEWHIDGNHHFAVEFLGNNDVRYVVFSPDPSHYNKIHKNTGTSTTSSLLQSVQPFNVLDWASHSRMAG